VSTRGLFVEDLAYETLRNLGFEIIEKRYRVEVDGIEVAEIDLIAKRDEETYAVEVKAGRITVTDIRQAYSNAKLIKAKPLIICRDFADKSAEKMAKSLGIEVIRLYDLYFFASPEELLQVFERSLEKFLLKVLSIGYHELKREDLKVIKAIASSGTLKEASERLKISERELISMIKELKKRGVMGKFRGFNGLRLEALLLLLYHNLCK